MISIQDCVASAGIVHRDVKPENILYTYNPSGQLIFKLGDFGVSNTSGLARTQIGTYGYMAPEIYTPGSPQTSKADIWSLFMVVVWIFNYGNFRNGNVGLDNAHQLAESVAAAGQPLEPLKAMARRNPHKRASAAQMMAQLGLFSMEPKAILCSHNKRPEQIPPIPTDDPPRDPVTPSGPPSRGPGRHSMRTNSNSVGPGSARNRSNQGKDVQMKDAPSFSRRG